MSNYILSCTAPIVAYCVVCSVYCQCDSVWIIEPWYHEVYVTKGRGVKYMSSTSAGERPPKNMESSTNIDLNISHIQHHQANVHSHDHQNHQCATLQHKQTNKLPGRVDSDECCGRTMWARQTKRGCSHHHGSDLERWRQSVAGVAIHLTDWGSPR